MIKLVEICELANASNSSKQRYTLREVYINSNHVVSLREETSFKQKLLEGVMPDNLDNRQEFTRLTLNKGQIGLDLIVVGTPTLIEKKLNEMKKEILHG